MTSDPLDDLFHWAALVAYVEAANARFGWPDSEEVRRRAYALYEENLRESRAGPQEPLDSAFVCGTMVRQTEEGPVAEAAGAHTPTTSPPPRAAACRHCAGWPGYGRSSDPEALLPQLLALPASRVAYQMGPVWWEYFALDCQRVLRHLEQERRALRRAAIARDEREGGECEEARQPVRHGNEHRRTQGGDHGRRLVRPGGTAA